MCFVFSCFTFFVFYILCHEQDPATTILVSHLGLLGAHYKDLEHASPLKQSLHIRYIETIYGYLTSIYIYIYTSQMLVHWYGPNKIIDPLITQVNMWCTGWKTPFPSWRPRIELLNALCFRMRANFRRWTHAERGRRMKKVML